MMSLRWQLDLLPRMGEGTQEGAETGGDDESVSTGSVGCIGIRGRIRPFLLTTLF